MESLIDIYLYIYIFRERVYGHKYTHSGTVGQRMTGAVMWETETLYSALGKEGRMRFGRSERGKMCWG